jgi:5'-3' exonuclease
LWIALLPFIDEERLHKAIATVSDKLTFDERERNSLNNDMLFVYSSAKGAEFLKRALSVRHEEEALPLPMDW